MGLAQRGRSSLVTDVALGLVQRGISISAHEGMKEYRYIIVFLFLAMAIPVHRNKKEEETGRQADPSEAKKLRRGLTLTLTPSLLSSGESKKRSRAVLSSTSTHGDLHLQRRRDGALLWLPRRRRRAHLLL